MTAWTLTDPITSAVYVMHNNPDKMTSPWPAKDFSHVRSNHTGQERARAFQAKPSPTQWQWEGVIRSQAHYDALLLWAAKPYPIHVTDHLGRTWQVVIRRFAPEDRRPTRAVPVRMRYVMETLNLGEVTP
jgi:hypothetical protein